MASKLKTTLFLVALIFLLSCSSKKSKDDFIGTYYIFNAQAIDSTISHIAGWTIELEAKNNFEIRNPNNILGGYWELTENKDKTYNLFLQSGGMTANATIKDNSIFFNRPYKMLDSVFRFASFVRTKK